MRWLPALLLGAACATEPVLDAGLGPTPCEMSGGTDPEAAQPDVVVAVGNEAALTISAPRSCISPTRVEVEVLGPDNRPVQHQTDFSPIGSSSASVRFRPEAVGPHIVTAMFEPGVARVVTTTWAAVDRRGETPAFAFNRYCQRYESMPSGAVLCSVSNTVTWVSPAGEEFVFTATPWAFAVADDAVWWANQGRLSRALETDAGLTVSHTCIVDGEVLALAALRDEALLVAGGQVTRLHLDGAECRATTPMLRGPVFLPRAPRRPRSPSMRRERW